MKLRILSTAVALFLFSLAVYPSEDMLAKHVCQRIAADDKTGLRKVMKSHNLKVRTIQKVVSCNGVSPLEFADKAEAADVGAFLIKKLPKGEVSNISLNTPKLKQAKLERLN